MKLTKTLLATTALTVAAGTAVTAQDMANSMTIVSWGGAARSCNCWRDCMSAMRSVVSGWLRR